MSRKKVIVRRFTGGVFAGYAPTTAMVLSGGTPSLDVMDLDGRAQPMPLADVKHICFVRDFNTADTVQPERLLRKQFLARPRSEGLWLRLHLRDADVLEGLAPLDVSFADGWGKEHGVYMLPPDIRGNTQRIFVPRSAIDAMEVLGVVTTPTRNKAVSTRAAEEQADLFNQPLPPDARAN